MIRKGIIFIIVLMGCLSTAHATHNRAGQITYKWITGTTYEFTVITYTKESSIAADRCEIFIDFGDGTGDSIQRTNGTPVLGCPFGGVSFPGTDIKKNEYTTTHTYVGPGNYTASVEDPNRNLGVLNIPQSVQVPFFIKTDLVISAFIGTNCSPTLANDPIDNACLGVPFYHNPGAVDVEGDSLVYSLSQCFGENGQPINGYTFPNQVTPGPNNQISIDPVTGTLTWDSPQRLGEYNICIRVEEYRAGIKLSSILRDMQITVSPCDHEPPFIEPMAQVCVAAGDQVTLLVTASDPDSGQVVELTATGLPLEHPVSPATFATPAPTSPIVGTFSWRTDCEHVRNAIYPVVFKAEDSHPRDPLVYFESVNIQVVGPAPENPSATPQGNEIYLSWDQSNCPNADGYRIYRRIDSIGFVPDDCEVGVPGYTGYQEIQRNFTIGNTTYIDDNNGQGLLHGQRYCYMVVATFGDGAVSYASVEFCAELQKDLPVITRVSVNATDNNTGSDTITWVPPSELDPIQWQGPYSYRLYRLTGTDPTEELIFTSNQSNNLQLIDSVFVDNGLNTVDNDHFYRIEFYNDQTLVGTTQGARSHYLTTSPSDNRLTLTWTDDVPWTSREFVVFRYDANADTIIAPIDTVDTTAFIDTGLVNGREYCYLIQAIGAYSGTGFPDPVFNFSQYACGIPIDVDPPCAPPGPSIFSDCTLDNVTLEWTNPNDVCADDVAGYNIYYAPVLGEPLSLFRQLNGALPASFILEEQPSLAGCYAVTAFDSTGNESEFSEVLCTDNCPIYELPNVFTPGGDGFNDFFVPFPYKYVESIDLEIRNRWGELVFESTNPDILWDGTHMNNGEPLESGVYFYVCTVNEIRLTGIEPRILKGYVQMINQRDRSPTN